MAEDLATHSSGGVDVADGAIDVQDPLLDDALVEDVSIDGMCGVY